VPNFADDIYLGRAEPGGRLLGNTAVSSGLVGIGPAARIYTLDGGAPTMASAVAVCALQPILAAGDALINGDTTLRSPVTGKIVAGFLQNSHIGRCLVMASTNAGDTTQTVTCIGMDIYGQAMSQRKTLNGTTPVNFSKAFKYVTRVTVSAALAGNLSVGDRDAFGFPVRVLEAGYVLKMGWGNVYGPDPGTVTTADTTKPARVDTNDVRGFYEPSSASDGAKRLTMTLMLTEGMVGVGATREIAFGVQQV